jgi:NADPH2:quinone reductase
MKALQVEELGAPIDVLKMVEIDSPEPGPGEVRIQIYAAALNFADELLSRGLYQLKPSLPFTPGMEVAGEVTAVGEGVNIEIGRRVMAVPALPKGGLAQECLAEARNCFTVPKDIEFHQAAAILIPYQTSHTALHRRAKLQVGETLLVHAGAGGVGSAAIQLGVAAGATVIATAGGPEKVEICKQLGAHHAIDYRAGDFVDEVKAITNGRGADVIYDPVGGEVFDRSRKCIAWEGRIVVVGFAGGTIPQIPANQLMFRNYSVVGCYMGGYSDRDRTYMDEIFTEIFDMVRKGIIKPLINKRLPLAEAPAAITALAARGTVGKVIIDT